MFFGERIVRFIMRKARAGIASDVGMETPWDSRTHTGLCHRHNRDLIAFERCIFRYRSIALSMSTHLSHIKNFRIRAWAF